MSNTTCLTQAFFRSGVLFRRLWCSLTRRKKHIKQTRPHQTSSVRPVAPPKRRAPTISLSLSLYIHIYIYIYIYIYVSPKRRAPTSSPRTRSSASPRTSELAKYCVLLTSTMKSEICNVSRVLLSFRSRF